MDQNMFDIYFNCFEEALKKLLQQTSEIEATAVSDSTHPEDKIFSAVVRIIGPNKGLVHIEMGEGLAKKLYEDANDEPAITELDLCFYLAEFANMVTGSGVTKLNNMYKGSNLRLAPPAIFTSSDIDISIPKAFAASKSYSTKLGVIRVESGFEMS